MCLILFSWKAHPRYELVLAANRDEFHERPTAAAAFWPDGNGILAGRDLQAGGTWMGLNRSAQFAAVTNYREPGAPVPGTERSRGDLVHRFLAGMEKPFDAARRVHGDGDAYRGFNLLLGDPGELAYVSNRNGGPEPVTPGLHGLSNHLLDTDWPKVRAGRRRLASLLSKNDVETEALFELLADAAPVGGGMPGAVERSLSPADLPRLNFIRSEEYGTRCSTVLLLGVDGRVWFEERRFGPDGVPQGNSIFEFSTDR